jgi:hypothetical protein
MHSYQEPAFDDGGPASGKKSGDAELKRRDAVDNSYGCDEPRPNRRNKI